MDHRSSARGWAAESELNWAVAERQSDAVLGRMSLTSVDLHDGSQGWRTGWCRPRGERHMHTAARALCGGLSKRLASIAFGWTTPRPTMRPAAWPSKRASLPRVLRGPQHCTPMAGTTCTFTRGWPPTCPEWPAGGNDQEIGTVRSAPIRFITSVDVNRWTPGSAPSSLS